MLYMKYAAEYPSKRLFSLNRSGFAGTQRYSIFPWSGDVGRTWSGFRAQLPVMLGMSMSGIPYAHSDAGGFAGGEGDNELFVRWLQFAGYSPILKPHGTAVYEVDKQAFSFPSEAALIEEPYREIARQAILRRYQMLPYNYTLSYRQAKYGEPLVRPLYYEYSKDSIAVTTEDEILWGDEILVAPVIHKGETSRKVYLPAGEWYYEGSNSLLLGGSYLDWSVRLTDIPVFVKAGSIIPLAPVGAISNTKDLKNDTSLIWHYYTSAQPSDYTLYEDDGESKNALSSHQYELITFKALPTDTGYRFLISSNNGSYKGKPAVRKMDIVIHNPRSTAGYQLLINGKPDNTRETLINSPDNREIRLHFNFTGKPVKMELATKGTFKP
jgi:oligosaccharide 4-alpha-D-glucosyltransferase